MKFGIVSSLTLIICVGFVLAGCYIISDSIKKDIAYVLNRCEPNNLNLKTKFVILNNNFGELKLKLHVAKTPTELQTGLMCIKDLNKGIDGMIFEFQTPQDKLPGPQSFFHLPLDFLPGKQAWSFESL